MTEPVLNPDANRKKMAEILFEKFEFGRIQVGIQALLSLYCEVEFFKEYSDFYNDKHGLICFPFYQGVTTGMLLDSGDGVTHCIPVYENFVLPHLVKRMNIAGRHMTQFLIKLLFRR